MFELWCIWDFLRRSNTCVLQGEKISKVLQIGHLRLVISILCQLAPSGQRKGHLVHFSAVCQLVENYFFDKLTARKNPSCFALFLKFIMSEHFRINTVSCIQKVNCAAAKIRNVINYIFAVVIHLSSE